MFNVPEAHIGVVASELSLWGFPFAIVGVFVSGYIFDIVGRKWTLFVSFTLSSIFVFLIPYTAPHVFPGLFLVRIMF